MATGKRKGSCNGFDWDDTALIEAYDRAMNQVKEKHEKKSTDSGALKDNASKEQKDRKNKWKVGDFCRALYKEDDGCYEAQILDINEKSNLCTVIFIGYENEDDVPLSQLSQSHGKLARRKQKAASKGSDYRSGSIKDDSSVCSDRTSSCSDRKRNDKCNASKGHRQRRISTPAEPSLSHNYPVPPFCPPFPSGPALPTSHMPPPPMPYFPNTEVTSENGLASMLMSWYMAGYHTGVHQGIQIGQRNTHPNVCSHTCCHN